MSSKKNNEIALSSTANNKRFSSPAVKLLLGLLLSVALLVACAQVPEEFWRTLLSSRFLEADVSGFFVLGGMYLLAVLLMAPLSPFALTAGLLFGFWWGTFLALLALNLGAALAFLIARHLLRRQFAEQLEGPGRTALLARAMRGDAVKTIAVLRLNPLIPFNLQNYVCGATGVNFARYALGTFLGAAPFTIALVYLGHAGRRLFVATGLEVEEWTLILFGAGLLLTLPMTWALFRKTLKRFREFRNNDKAATHKE